MADEKLKKARLAGLEAAREAKKLKYALMTPAERRRKNAAIAKKTKKTKELNKYKAAYESVVKAVQPELFVAVEQPAPVVVAAPVVAPTPVAPEPVAVVEEQTTSRLQQLLEAAEKNKWLADYPLSKFKSVIDDVDVIEANLVDFLKFNMVTPYMGERIREAIREDTDSHVQTIDALTNQLPQGPEEEKRSVTMKLRMTPSLREEVNDFCRANNTYASDVFAEVWGHYVAQFSGGATS